MGKIKGWKKEREESAYTLYVNQYSGALPREKVAFVSVERPSKIDYADVSNRWFVKLENKVLKKGLTKDKAKEVALNWMRKHPNG